MKAVPSPLLEMSKMYLPLLEKFERLAAIEMRRKLASVRTISRQQAERAIEEGLRQSELRRRIKAGLLLRGTVQRPPSVLAQWRQKLSDQTSSTVEKPQLFPEAVDETLDWIKQIDGEPLTTVNEIGAPSSAKVDHGPVKLDPFVVAAGMYKEISSSRLACRKCDYTLSRGVRGVHLFSWHDNYHLALNDELADTLTYKEVTDPIEMKRSPWKRAKVSCPCCGSSVGSLGVANGRMKVMFKGINVAWRRSAEGAWKGPPPSSKSMLKQRPLGVGLSASWLQNNAGLMTHTRRWVLDSTVIHALLAATADPSSSKSPSSSTSSNDAVAVAVDVGSENLVRISEKDPLSLTENMKLLALRTSAFEALTLLSSSPSMKAVHEVLAQYESALAKVPVQGKDTPYEYSVESALAFIRFAALNRLAQVGAEPGKSATVTATMKTPKFYELAKRCTTYVKTNHPAIDHLPTRLLCSAARQLHRDPDVAEGLVRIITARKQAFGPTAGAFGRSAEYLEVALKRMGWHDKTIEDALEKTTSLHPTPGGRFQNELEPNGFVELLCNHGNGLECNRRATHAPPNPDVRTDTGNRYRIPLYCRHHAPPGSLPTSEGYRGVIPPLEEPMMNSRPRFQQNHHTGGHYHHPRRRMVIVDVPDEGATEYSTPESGTLYLGPEWESHVKVVYQKDELAEAASYLDDLISRAEQAMANHPQNLPSSMTAVSIDAEWKPEFVFDENNRLCSIIQVATRDKTFVFDAIALASDLDPVMKRLLKSKAVLKIGHGLSEDFSRIAQGLSRLAGHPGRATEYFPIESVVELTGMFCKAESRVYTNGARPSLNAMVDAATGLRLDKRCQMTDWEKRPLSPSQIRYAATDAACGLVLFDTFARKIAETSGQTEFNFIDYVSRDDGSTAPQRAPANDQVKPFYPDAVARTVSYGFQSPRQFHGTTGQHHSYTPRFPGMMARGARMANPYTPRGVARKILSKYELRRFRELKNDLIAQGVRVDEHAKLEGLEVARGHLQKSLSKVVRETLVDTPVDASSPATNGTPPR